MLLKYTFLLYFVRLRNYVITSPVQLSQYSDQTNGWFNKAKLRFNKGYIAYKKWFRFPQCFRLVCVLLNQKLREQDCEEGEDGNNFHVADVVLIENEDNQTDCYESCII